MRGVREVDDVDAELSETLLQRLPLGRPLPVVPFEDDVEADPLPHLHLVLLRLDDGHVDAAQAVDDGQPFGERDDRRPAFEAFDQLVGDDPGDQPVAVAARPAQEGEVPDVEQVEDTGRVSDTGHPAVSPRRAGRSGRHGHAQGRGPR
ncbi:hypothetical protein GCM10010512_21760 [Streptomyces thermoviolaceus subsp. thermoviolaceus]|nr:hypothetical protein GCM10010499_06810 [Streptomyces thermoviolaceus subsp. apingens]GHA90045.1 hypothetical protein GCM10010512_21760 [Streptomyces thermoviolaceus subsp. thermoviolaceus]